MIYLNAFLLVVIAVLIYPAYRSTVLDGQLEQLQNNAKPLKDRTTPRIEGPAIPGRPEAAPMLSHAKIYQLHLRRGSGDENEIELAFDEVSQSYTLIFAVPPNDFDSFEVGIVRNGRVVWRSNVRATRKNGSQLISVQLKAPYFQDGQYSLQILGRSAQQQTKFQPYKLIVRTP